MRILLLFVLLSLALGCKNTGKTEIQLSASASKTITCQYKISGMDCNACEETVQNSVKKLNGVKSVQASHEKGEAVVEFSPELTDTSSIKTNINSTGFTVTKILAVATDSI